MDFVTSSKKINVNNTDIDIFDVNGKQLIRIKDIFEALGYKYNPNKRCHNSYNVIYRSIGKENLVYINVNTSKGIRKNIALDISDLSKMKNVVNSERKKYIDKIISMCSTNIDSNLETNKPKSVSNKKLKSKKILGIDFSKLTLRDLLSKVTK